MEIKMISVCMATYNGERYIKRQLDSILVQLSEADEVIISDDSSSDKTLEIIKSYQDRRIILIEGQKFKSPIYNFENALRGARGDLIFLADQDDIWELNKVEVVKKYMTTYDLVVSDATIVDEAGDLVHLSFYDLNCSNSGLIRNIYKNSFLGCTMALNRRILNAALPFPPNLPMHDWWLGLIGEAFGNTYFIRDKLIRYRRHSHNFSATSGKSMYPLSTKIFMRFIMIKNLICVYRSGLR